MHLTGMMILSRTVDDIINSFKISFDPLILFIKKEGTFWLWISKEKLKGIIYCLVKLSSFPKKKACHK